MSTVPGRSTFSHDRAAALVRSRRFEVAARKERFTPGPPRRHLRLLGTAGALALALIAHGLHGPAGLAVEAVAALLFAVAAVWPGVLRWPFALFAAPPGRTARARRTRPGKP